MSVKKALIVVDMQNDFVSGTLGTKEAQAIIPAIVKKIQDAHANGYPIMFTQDTHFDNYLETQEGQILPVKHCIQGTWGHQIVPELYALRHSSDVAVEKFVFGVDQNVMQEVVHDIGAANAEEYELCGVCTDICVISNAVIFRTLYPESKITVDAKAVAGVTPEKNKAALEVLKSLQVNVINEYPIYDTKQLVTAVKKAVAESGKE